MCFPKQDEQIDFDGFILLTWRTGAAVATAPECFYTTLIAFSAKLVYLGGGALLVAVRINGRRLYSYSILHTYDFVREPTGNAPRILLRKPSLRMGVRL